MAVVAVVVYRHYSGEAYSAISAVEAAGGAPVVVGEEVDSVAADLVVEAVLEVVLAVVEILVEVAPEEAGNTDLTDKRWIKD